MIGTTLGKYRIAQQIGTGGMGEVYQAEHVELGRSVAIKMLLPEMSQIPGTEERLRREAQIASAINHPGIVDVYDIGRTPDRRLYIVMEYLVGESLEQCLARVQRLPATTALSLALQISEALAATHISGIIHRDLKPGNIFLIADSLVYGKFRAKILDFGIARNVNYPSNITGHGAAMGTLRYMSREQALDTATADHRTDLFALGCIIFEMLAGRRAFPDLTLEEIRQGHRGTNLIVAPGELPTDVLAVVSRLLAEQPSDRHSTSAEVSAEIERILANLTAAPSTFPSTGAPAGAPMQKTRQLARLIETSIVPPREHVLHQDSHTIGRNRDNDIVLSDRSVSSYHAKIFRRPGGSIYIIENISLNEPMHVDGTPCMRVALLGGNVVGLGGTRLRFVAPGELLVL